MFACVCVCVLSVATYLSGNKRVSFEEFLPIFLSCQQKKDSGSMEDFIEGLRVFDKDGNGFINSAELRHVLTSLGEWTVYSQLHYIVHYIQLYIQCTCTCTLICIVCMYNALVSACLCIVLVSHC